MLINGNNRWRVGTVTLAVWLAAAAGAGYWVLRWMGGGQPTVTAPVASTPILGTPDASAVARLLGDAAPVAAGGQTVAVAAPMKLLGVVMTPGASGRGAALIALGDKPARPYRVGSRVGQDHVLQAVEARKAVLGPDADGAPTLTLELPPRK